MTDDNVSDLCERLAQRLAKTIVSRTMQLVAEQIGNVAGANQQPNSPFPEPAEGNDLDHTATGGVLIPSMVARQSGEPEAGETVEVSASASRSPASLAPGEPAPAKVGCGQAPEFRSQAKATEGKAGTAGAMDGLVRRSTAGTGLRVGAPTRIGKPSWPALGRTSNVSETGVTAGETAPNSVSDGKPCCSLPSRESNPSATPDCLPSESSSGDGLGIHEPGSNTSGFGRTATPARSGRARDRAKCPAVTGNSSCGSTESRSAEPEISSVEFRGKKSSDAPLGSRASAAEATALPSRAGIAPGPQETIPMNRSITNTGIGKPGGTSTAEHDGPSKGQAGGPSISSRDSYPDLPDIPEFLRRTKVDAA